MVMSIQGTEARYINYKVQVHVSWPQKLSRILQAKFSNVQIIFLGFIFSLYKFRQPHYQVLFANTVTEKSTTKRVACIATITPALT